MKNSFQKFASKTSNLAGSTYAFLLAFGIIIAWLALGPRNHYSDTWLITIATITDVIIFLMVFLIQNTQNRDSKAIQLKLNELIVADQKARDAFIGLETLTDAELMELDDEFQRLLASIETTPAMRKLHKKVAHEKERRTTLYDQAEHLMGALLSPLTSKEVTGHQQKHR
ncbi:MAG TPA: low affinity iron permease family protein [Candidatus Saccharimonadales bacterium]|nr:low affinity iron permease family protein [Candidatus Saccharimonadales bacterium]